VVELVKLALGQADDIGVAALLGAGILGVAGVLVWAGWRLTYRRASARGVAVALELSALPVAWYMLTGEGGWGTRLGGGLVAASCAAVIALLLVATSTAALRPPA
jgi:hypothetical protein